jgi:hypothetical protein
MIAINAYDYERSAKLTYPVEPQATLLVRELADGRMSLEHRANRLAGIQCPRTIGRALELLQAGGYQPARLFLPALHAHQIALWFNSTN